MIVIPKTVSLKLPQSILRKSKANIVSPFSSMLSHMSPAIFKDGQLSSYLPLNSMRSDFHSHLLSNKHFRKLPGLQNPQSEAFHRPQRCGCCFIKNTLLTTLFVIKMVPPSEFTLCIHLAVALSDDTLCSSCSPNVAVPKGPTPGASPLTRPQPFLGPYSLTSHSVTACLCNCHLQLLRHLRVPVSGFSLLLCFAEHLIEITNAAELKFSSPFILRTLLWPILSSIKAGTSVLAGTSFSTSALIPSWCQDLCSIFTSL